MEKIVIKGLQKSYTNRKKQSTVVLYKCDLNVYQGEFLVLLGESGCGKTSLLKVIAGIEPYDFGEIFFDGIPAEELTQMEKNMSYVQQNIVLFPNRTVFENIMQPLEILKVPKKDRVARVKELGDLFDINILLTRRPRELSGGQQQKVAIARALAKEPSICLFDEPLSALDPIYHDEIIEFLKDIHKKTNSTYLYSTHNQIEAFRLADRIALMNHRKIEQIGCPQDFINNPKTTFVCNFLKDTFLFSLSGRYEDGYFINDEYKIPFNLDNKTIKKVKDKDIIIYVKSNNIIIDKNGMFAFELLSQNANELNVRFKEFEFSLKNDDLLDFEKEVRANINLEGSPIFVDGINVNYEGV